LAAIAATMGLLVVSLMHDPNAFHVTNALHVLAVLIYVRPRWLWLGGITQEEVEEFFISSKGWSFPPSRLVKLLVRSRSKTVNPVLVHIIALSGLQVIYVGAVIFAYLLFADAPKPLPLWMIYPSQVCLLLCVFYHFTSPVDKPRPTPTGYDFPLPAMMRTPMEKRKERLTYVFRKCAQRRNKLVTNIWSKGEFPLLISFVATLASLFYVLDCLGTTGEKLADWKLLYAATIMQVIGTVVFVWPGWLSGGQISDEDTFVPRRISPSSESFIILTPS
jgi:hypothetical protein